MSAPAAAAAVPDGSVAPDAGVAALEGLAWPLERLDDGIEALAREAGLARGGAGGGAEPRAVPPPAGDEAALARFVAARAGRRGLEAEPVDAPYPELPALVRRAAPALLRLPGATADAPPRFLLVRRGGRHAVTLLGPTLEPARVPADALVAALAGRRAARVAGRVDAALDRAGLGGGRRERARAALLKEMLVAERVGAGFLLRPSGPASLLAHAREAGLPARLVGALALHAAAYALLVLSWWLLGRGVLGGGLDRGWLVAWGLILLTTVPLGPLASWLSGVVSIRAGATLRRELLRGALKLEPDEIRRSGAGELLGRVIEAGEVETLALGGGLMALTATLELAVSGFVLASGAGGAPHAVLLGVAIGLTAAGATRYYRRRQAWTDGRLALTDDAVERMVGHRTRLAQMPRGRRHEGEDEALERYLGLSGALDRAAVRLAVLPGRGFFLASLAALGPALVLGDRSPAAVAVAFGGTLLATGALRRFGDGLARLAGAAVAWSRVGPLWRAARRSEADDWPWHTEAAPAPGPAGGVILEARDLSFRYRDRGEPALRGVRVAVRAGERVLIEGPTGAGKSTLGAILAAAREPTSGLVLLGGFDRQTTGAAGWRRRVALVPPFHENHVLMHSLAFNLLLGRGWPPGAEDLAEAEAVVRALGLGPLLDRMPSGLHQMVGETGWQLSHGERARVFVARAILQRPEVVVLDESFDALDPETLEKAMRCVLERTRTTVCLAGA